MKSKNDIKKIFSFLTLLLISQTTLAQIKILTCEPEWAALAVTLGGKDVDVTSATTSMQDLHQIQARPSLIAKTRQADLLICSGAELENGWLPLLLQKSANKKIQQGAAGYFMATQYVALLDKNKNADRSAGDVHTEGNPHIQVNPYNMLKVAEALLPVLVQLMPDKKDILQKNHDAFTQQMQQALMQWQPKIAALKGKKVVVYHDSWVYLSAWLEMPMVGKLEPKPGLPPTSKHLAELVSSLKNNPADVIIYTHYQDPKPAQWLSNHTSIPYVLVPLTIADWEKDNAIINWYSTILTTLGNGK